MNLSDIAVTDSSGIPPKLVLYGEGGVGKTTLAAEFPDPIILPTEAGTIGLDGVASFPLLTDLDDVLDAMRALYRDPHQYRTVIVDSVSQMELLVWEAVCRRQQPPWASIETPGYGRGYAESVVEWKQFLTAVGALRDKGMLPVLICHQDVRTHTDPASGTYDQVQIRLHRKAAQLVIEDADVLALLAQEVVFAADNGDAGRKGERKPQGSGRRVLRLSPRPQWQAKCRYRDVPEQLPIELDHGWATLAEAVPAIARHGQPVPAQASPANPRTREPAKAETPGKESA